MAPDLDPVREGPFWIFPDGTRLPVISGGADDGGDGGGDDGDDGGDDTDDGDDGGKPAGGSTRQIRGGNRRDELPPEVKSQLRKANKEAETARRKLKEYEDRDKSDADKRADAEKRAEAAELEVLRLKVGIEKGLDPEIAELLKGSTRDELEDHADRLAKKFGGSGKPGRGGNDGKRTSFDGGGRNPGGHQVDMNDALRRAAGK